MIIVPPMQSRYHFIKDPGLMGYFKLADPPGLEKLSGKSWFKGKFQEEFQKSVEDHVGFRNTLTRLSNQYDYSLFGITNAGWFVGGYDKVLFEKEYIFEYTGNYFIGKTTINRKVNQLKEIISDLKKIDIDLIPVLLPGKAGFFPEDIPAHFHPERRSISNYEYFRKRFDQCGVPCLDLNSYFRFAKDTSRFPLFPKFGMHWSTYGMIRAMDSLLRFTENVHQTKLPHIKIEKITMSDSVPSEENDIGILLNLIFPLCKAPTAYPQYTVVSDPQQKKLKVLVISDSYYDLVQNTIAPEIFSGNEYWYYNLVEKSGPRGASGLKKIDKTNLVEKLKQFDLILLMSSDMNLHNGFFGFIEETYYALHPNEHENPVRRYEDLVRNSREWFTMVVEKAHRTGHTVERVTTGEARYQFYVDYPQLKNKTSEDTIEYLASGIWFDPQAYLSIREKAKKNKIPFEQMINIEANYLYSQSKKKK